MRRYTIKEITDCLKVERTSARGFVAMLEELELARDIGERRAVNSRGGAERVYELDEFMVTKLALRLTSAGF